MKDLLYLTLVQCLEVFLGKIRDGSTTGLPVVNEDFVKEVNGTIGERLDGEAKEIPNPFKGEVFSTLVVGDDGEITFVEQPPMSSDTIMTVPHEEGTVTMEMESALKHAIDEYYRLKADHEELDDWWNTASKLVPLLWD
tara:strand:- start:73 stop:489 length:417 start_codon:yes stop_codon:yes gene_type:complete